MTEPKLIDVFNNAAKNLPEGFRIEIVIEKNGGSVSLLDPDGNDHDFPSNRECMADEINDAVVHAVSMEKEVNERDYGSNGGIRCDTFCGPCACGAWH